MDRLLDNLHLRIINILRRMHQLNGGLISVAHLADHINVNEKTLLSTLYRVQDELVKSKIDAKVIIEKNKTVSLKEGPSYSLTTLYKRYIRESVYYQLLDLVFTGEYYGLKDAAEKLGISLPALYKKLYILEEVISEFDLTIDRKSDCFILGKESNIRLFMFHLYWNSLDMFDWPFDQTLKERSEDIYARVVTNEFQNFSVVIEKKITLWIAVIIKRIDEGYFLSEQFKHSIDSNITNTLNYDNFYRVYTKELPEFDESECFFFFIILISDRSYKEKFDFMSSALRFREPTRPDFEKMGLDFISEMLDYTQNTVSDSEFISLYKDFLTINLFFNVFGVESDLFENNEMNRLLEKELIDKFPSFLTFYVQFFNKFPEHQKYNIRLNYFKYIRAILTVIKKNFFYEEVRIVLIVDANHVVTEHLKKRIEWTSPVPIRFVDYQDKRIDVIITDVDIHKEAIPIVRINEPFLDCDNLQILSVLKKLSKKKIG